MKIINKIFLLGFLIGMIAFVGCSEDDLVTPSPSPAAPAGTQGVYFPTSNKSAVELMPVDPTEFKITIARTDSTGSVDVPIIAEVNDDNIFIVPSSVSFADGETVKTFKITFPTAVEGKTYKLKLSVVGEGYVNPYVAGLSYVTTNVTRVKWEVVEKPMVYIDGTVNAFFGAPFLPMYVNAEKAKLGNATRYRFLNAYKVPVEGADKDGIYDGYASNDPGDFLDGNYYTIIEIGGDKGGANDVFMFAGDTGMDWGYGVFNIGSVYSNVSTDKAKYPLGSKKGDVITFPASSLYTSMKNYDSGAKRVASNPTIIYLSKEAYIAANLKIDSFNEVEYEDDAVEDGTFKSKAYADDTWDQIMLKAIDADPENKESEYKNLFYLPNLYKDDFGLAFYMKSGAIIIPENQSTGNKVFGKDVFVSQSDDIKSQYFKGSEEGYDNSLKKGDKGYDENGGKDRYVFGLKFHYKDGTNLGDFKEVLLLSKEDVVIPMVNAKKGINHRFEIQNKVSPKELKKNVQGAIMF